jgi:hypothetical protein
MKPLAFFDLALLATLPGRTIEPAAMDRRGGIHVVRGVLGRGVCDGHILHAHPAPAE